MADIRLNDLPAASAPLDPDGIMWLERDAGGGNFVSEKATLKQVRSPVYTLRADTYTAVEGDHILPDNSSAALTINLPATPSTNTVVRFRPVVDQLYSVFGLTVGRNGETIMGLSEDMTVGGSSDNHEFFMLYNGTTWEVYKDKAVGTTL